MEVKAGYKLSEVGVIPEDWAATTLGEFLSLKRGHDLTGDQRRPGDVPVMGSAGQNGFHDRALVKAPGIVVGRSGASFGQAHYCGNDFWPHNTAMYVTDFRGNDPRYTFYFLRSLDFSRHNSGGAQQSLNRNFIYPIPIAVPPFAEQREIAAALLEVDALLAKLDRLIAKKRDLKQAQVHQLLTGETRLPGFSGVWETRRVASFSSFITKGATPTTYGFGWEPSGVIFLRSECVSANGLDLNQSMFISEQAHSELIRGEVRPGDILITITGNVGRVVLLDERVGVGNINQHIARIRVNDASVSPSFVFHWLSQPAVRHQYSTITTGQAYPQISLQQVRSTLIPLGSLAEQSAIAIVLSDVDADLAALEARRDKTQLIKQGMMQELLTGMVRLI